MHGCDRSRGRPRLIGDYELDRCPNHYLKRHDPLRDAVVSAYQDREAGVIHGWPDEWAGAVVSGVRYVNAEHGDSKITVVNKQTRQHAARQRAESGKRRRR